jgi:hypothetical protein
LVSQELLQRVLPGRAGQILARALFNIQESDTQYYTHIHRLDMQVAKLMGNAAALHRATRQTSNVLMPSPPVVDGDATAVAVDMNTAGVKKKKKACRVDLSLVCVCVSVCVHVAVFV